LEVGETCRIEKLQAQATEHVRSKRMRIPTNRYGFGVENHVNSQNEMNQEEGAPVGTNTKTVVDQAQQVSTQAMQTGVNMENNEVLWGSVNLENDVHKLELKKQTDMSQSQPQKGNSICTAVELNIIDTQIRIRQHSIGDDDTRIGAPISPPIDCNIDSSNGRFVTEVIEVEIPNATVSNTSKISSSASTQNQQSRKNREIVSTSPKGQLCVSLKDVDISICPIKQSDIRKNVSRVVENKSECDQTEHDVDDKENNYEWSQKQLSQLKLARCIVNPTSDTFWFDVAKKVDGKTASECRTKWFESCSHEKKPKVETKRTKKRKLSPEIIQYDDDIFKATPMRKFIDNHADDDLEINIDDISPIQILGSATNLLKKSKNQINRQSMSSTVDSSDTYNFIPYKRKDVCPKYLQSLKRNFAKASKVQVKKNKKQQSKTTNICYGRNDNNKRTRAIAVTVREGNVNLNAILSPSGRVEVKDRTENDDDEDDFWNELYQEEDE
jgi:hypothetical protein